MKTSKLTIPIIMAIAGMQKLHEGFKLMNNAYDEKNLNDIQPTEMKDVLRYSLDEQVLYSDECLRKWYEIAGLPYQGDWLLESDEGQHSVNIIEFLMENKDGLSPEELDQIQAMKWGEKIVFGGGAMATSTLHRMA